MARWPTCASVFSRSSQSLARSAALSLSGEIFRGRRAVLRSHTVTAEVSPVTMIWPFAENAKEEPYPAFGAHSINGSKVSESAKVYFPHRLITISRPSGEHDAF